MSPSMVVPLRFEEATLISCNFLVIDSALIGNLNIGSHGFVHVKDSGSGRINTYIFNHYIEFGTIKPAVIKYAAGDISPGI